MPLFAITGWTLHLDRRKKKRAANAQQRVALTLGAAPVAESETLVVYAGQTGFAREIAWQTGNALRTGGQTLDVLAASKLMPAALQRASRVLFVANTFGEGEPPDGASSFARMLDDELPLTGTSFGVLGLGDRLCDAYCEFGQRIEEWLSRNGARPLFSTNRRRQCRPGSACAVA